MRPDLKQYEDYYQKHPEKKAYDDKRRERGGPLGKPGSIDGRYRANVSMLVSSICMAICPFSRPNRSLHRFVRFMLRRSYLARVIFPYIDNILYGRRWKPRKALDWLDYPKGPTSEDVPVFKADA